MGVAPPPPKSVTQFLTVLKTFGTCFLCLITVHYYIVIYCFLRRPTPSAGGMQSFVSVSVCLSLRSHNPKTTWPNFAKFFSMLSVFMAQ